MTGVLTTKLFDNGNTDMFTGLWIDDLRPLPSDLDPNKWTTARSAWEGLLKLELIQFEQVSLDNDLASFVGNIEITGYDILNWLVQRKLEGQHVPKQVYVHSANVVAVPKMQQIIKKHFS